MLDAVGILMVASFPLISLMVLNVKDELRKDKPEMDRTSASIVMSLVMIFIGYPVILFAAWIWHAIIG